MLPDPAHRQKGNSSRWPPTTFFHDPEQTPDDLPLLAVKNTAEQQAASPTTRSIAILPFDLRGFGIVSCYNALPQSVVPTPGAHLKRVAEQAQDR